MLSLAGPSLHATKGRRVFPEPTVSHTVHVSKCGGWLLRNGQNTCTAGLTLDTWVPLGEVSMVVTGTAVTVLADAGEFDLSTDVATVVGGDTSGITIEQLLAHRAGLPRWSLPVACANDPFADYHRARRASDIAQLAHLVESPVGKPRLSLLGYVVLGAVIERACGSFVQGVKETVIGPLGAALGIAAEFPDLACVDPLGNVLEPWKIPDAVVPALGLWGTLRGVGMLLDAVFGDHQHLPVAASWHEAPSGALWHNGHTRSSAMFVGGRPGCAVPGVEADELPATPGMWAVRFDNARPLAMTTAKGLRQLCR